MTIKPSIKIERTRTSTLAKLNLAYKIEYLLDLCFLAGPGVAILALALAAYTFWAGNPLLSILALVVMLGALVVSYGRYIAPWQLRTTHLKIKNATVDAVSTPAQPVRFVFFSDLHLARIKKQDWVQRVVDAANVQKPDVVLIGGDFAGIMGESRFEDVLAPLKQLHAPLGIYAILGNHDNGMPGIDHTPELEAALSRMGVQLLRNDCVQLNPQVQLLSADELWSGQSDVDKAFADAHALAPQNAPIRRVFLGHNPDLMTHMQPNYKADLFIFGHTHHGQIYIPVLPALAVPIESHYYRGTFHTPNGMVYVSSGAGEGNSPIRIGTWPEIVTFEV